MPTRRPFAWLIVLVGTLLTACGPSNSDDTEFNARSFVITILICILIMCGLYLVHLVFIKPMSPFDPTSGSWFNHLLEQRRQRRQGR